MNTEKKGNFLSFILPYVLILGIIVGVLFLFNGSTNVQTKQFSQGEIVTIYEGDNETDPDFETKLNKSVLWTYDITNLNVVSKKASNLISLSGYYKQNETNYAFYATLDYENSNYAISYIINNRYSADGTLYYNTNVLTYSDPYESNFLTDYLPSILMTGAGIVLVFFLFSRMTNC